MRDFLSEDLLAEEIEGATKRKTQYRSKRKKRMPLSVKNKRKRTRKLNDSQKRKKNKAIRKRRKNDRNFRLNERDRQKAWRKKNPTKKKPKSRKRPSTRRSPSRRRRASTGFILPFELEFVYNGKQAYLMSLSEMFDAINIYVEGETAILVDLNDFLDNTEWYDEEDFYSFLDLIDGSYAVLDEDPNDAWSEFTLDERDPPAKRKVEAGSAQRVASRFISKLYSK